MPNHIHGLGSLGNRLAAFDSIGVFAWTIHRPRIGSMFVAGLRSTMAWMSWNVLRFFAGSHIRCYFSPQVAAFDNAMELSEFRHHHADTLHRKYCILFSVCVFGYSADHFSLIYSRVSPLPSFWSSPILLLLSVTETCIFLKLATIPMRCAFKLWKMIDWKWSRKKASTILTHR